MPIVDLLMPKMGESVQEGTVIEWTVKVGDHVEKDQSMLNIATDKVDTEVPAPASGTVVEILVQQDETVEVGTPIARINTEGGDAPAPAAASSADDEDDAPRPHFAPPADDPEPAPAATSGAVVDMVMPKMGESVQEGTVIDWLVQVGDKVEKDQALLNIATDKVDTEVPSPASGTLVEILVRQDQTVEVGTPIARISTGAGGAPAASAPKASAPAASAAPAKAQAAQSGGGPIAGDSQDVPRRDGDRFYSPLVRRIAKENNIGAKEIAGVKGSGQGGRVTKADMLAYLKVRGSVPAAASSSAPARSASAPAAASGAAKTGLVGGLGEKKTLEELGYDPSRVTVTKMNFMRKKIASHMRESLDTSAHVYSVHEADMQKVFELREEIKDEFKKEFHFSLTYTSFILWAAARALRQYPIVNSRLNGDEVITPDYVNIGMAVALPDNGLIVPKIKDAENMTIAGIQRRVNDLATRARDGKLTPDELSGGTFSLTNMGSYGTIFGLPIISQPEVAIMGVGALQQRAVIKQGGIAVRYMMYLSLAYDHRIVDGALAAQFLTAVCEALENVNPMQLGFDRRKR